MSRKAVASWVGEVQGGGQPRGRVGAGAGSHSWRSVCLGGWGARGDAAMAGDAT